jgi:hypothetical protein
MKGSYIDDFLTEARRSTDTDSTTLRPHMAKPVVETIVDAISPYIGQMMAQSSIQLHCKRLGIDASRIQGSQVEQLLQQISLGLNIFIGREKTESVMRDIRAAVGRGA